MKIHKIIEDFNLVLVGNDKKPIGWGWTKKIYRKDCDILKKHLAGGGNYGVQSNNSSVIINGKSYFLIVIDFDKKEIMDKLIEKFPKTFTTTSGSPKKCVHLWLASDNNKSFKIKDEKLDTLVDVLGAGNYVISPGSKHKSGSTYKVVKNIPIAFMPYAEIEAILKPHDKKPKKLKKIIKPYSPKGTDNNITEKIYNSVSMKEILDEIGVDTSKNPTNCSFHNSVGGKCFSWDSEVAHCFNCDNSWNKYTLIREAKNFTDKDTFNWFAEKCGMVEELEKSRKEWKEKNKKEVQGDVSIFSRRGQIESFWKEQPFYYDASKIFWLWDSGEYKWVVSDETDFCNSIFKALHIETINSKNKAELIEGFKQVGRIHKPKPIKKSWVQFKDKIYDVKTDEIFEASPEYFVCNPIPWKVGVSEEMPTIDKYFDDWIKGQDESWKNTLYQITAYNTSTDKFMQRLIALLGGGSNGKGTFIKLQQKFLGEGNYVSSEIKALSEDRFEPFVLFRKLLCVMGEVSYDDLKNTNQLKKLGGEDKISFQKKNKTPFTDDNTATCICLTNSMPITPDKTQGFYRKWLIIDFKNQFKSIDKNLIDEIPPIEFENLAKKCLRVLKKLYEKPHFTNEGDFGEREKRYEERSNPVLKFIEERCEEIPNALTPLRDFTNVCNTYLKQKHLRILNAHQIGKILRAEGFIIGNRDIGEDKAVCIINLQIKFMGKL